MYSKSHAILASAVYPTMQTKMSMIERNKPEGKNVIGVKWIFRTKYNADGIVNKYNKIVLKIITQLSRLKNVIE